MDNYPPLHPGSPYAAPPVPDSTYPQYPQTPYSPYPPASSSDGSPYQQTPPPAPPHYDAPVPAPAPQRKRGPWLVALVAAVALLAGGGGAAAGVALSNNGTAVTTTAGGTSTVVSPAAADTVAAVAAKVAPSVVTIDAEGTQSSGIGSGVIIRSDGLILTNNHVVSTVPNGTLTVILSDGRRAPATVVGTDPTSDLAVISVSGLGNLQAASFADSDSVTVGQLVIAIGSPLGLEGTVTSGVISAVHRPVLVSGEQANASTSAIDAIQTDTAINPGNSGGPLLNDQGQIVGINSAIASVAGASSGQQSAQSGNIGVGFAIPSNTARDVAGQLIDGKTVVHPQLGVQASDYATQDTAGAQIKSVNPGSAAAQAGLQPGDVVVKLGDQVTDGVDALAVAVRGHTVGDVVTVSFLRDGASRTVSVTLTAGK